MEDKKPRYGLWFLLIVVLGAALWIGRSGCEQAVDAVDVFTDGITGKQALEVREGVETQLRGIVDQRESQIDETRRR